MPEHVGRRERKRVETRQRIRLAALRLALEHGLDGASVQAISERADVAPRTFFAYFPTKEAAFLPEQPWTAARIHAEMLARPVDEPVLDTLQAVMRAMAREVTVDSEALRLWRAVAVRHPHLVEHLLGKQEERMQALTDGIARRPAAKGRDATYAGVAAWIAWTLGQLAVQNWLRSVDAEPGGSQRIDACVDAVFEVLRLGI